MRSIAVAVVLAASVAEAQDADRVVRGVVVNEDTNVAVEGALVMGRFDTATTDQDGGFAIVLAPDEAHIVVSAPGYAMRSVAVENAFRIPLVVSHEVIEIEGSIPRPRRITPPPPPPPPVERPEAQSYELTTDDLRALPGTANDALRAAQVLPGVARLPYSFGGLVMRGSAPRDNVVFLDGIEVPIAFHFGGISSFYPSSMLDGIEVTSSGIPADYGRAQGGMVEMKTREPRRDRWRQGGSIGLLDASAIAEGPYRGGGILLGIRRSYLDIVLAPFVAEDVPLPSYWDAQIRGSFGNPRKQGRVTPMMFLALDHLTATQPKEDREDESSITSFFIRFAAPYERQWGKTTMRIVPWAGTNQLHFESRVNNVVEKFSRPVYPAGLRFELGHQYKWGELRGGLDTQGGHLTHYQAGLGHKGDILEQVNGTTTIDWLDSGLWGETRFKVGRLDLRPGLRIERYGLSDETVIDPRLALELPLTPALKLRQSVGRFHQPPTPGDVDPNGGNPALKASYFDSASLGVEGNLADGWGGSLTGFYGAGEKQGVRRMMSQDFSASLGSLGPTVAQLLEKQLGLSFPRDNIGRAQNYGIELLLKKRSERYFGLVSYTLAKATRVDDPRWWNATDALGNPSPLTKNQPHGPRPFDLDQRHNLNVAGSIAFTKWRIGARIQAVSGAPYSPSVDSTSSDPVVDPYAGRLPWFFQVDFRADRIWKKCWGTMDLYFDIQNVTNRRNVEGRDLDEFGVEVDIRGLPLLPFIGIEFIPD